MKAIGRKNYLFSGSDEDASPECTNERDIAGKSAEMRRHVRQNHSRPLVDAFRIWCETRLLRIPGKGDLAIAMRYALNRWPVLACLYPGCNRKGHRKCEYCCPPCPSQTVNDLYLDVVQARRLSRCSEPTK